MKYNHITQSIPITNLSAMKQLFSKLMALLFCMAILPATAVMAQRTVSGVILSSEDQEPMVGASVTVSETQLKKSGSSSKKLGTITDIDGRFTIVIPRNVTELECRSIGYNPRTIFLVDGVDSYDIVLDPSSVTLSDVVVTGYQAIERRKLTASITKMEVDDSKIGAIMNIDQALAGQVAGLSAIQSSGSPGAPLKIRIRGTSSLQGTQDPLWVIDGVPMNGTEMPSTEELKDISACLGYSSGGETPYPKATCISVNHQICHGIPDQKVLKKGDILNIDVTVIKNGFHGDTSRMFKVEPVSIAASRLCEITFNAMWKGICMVKPGAHFGDIGYAIQQYVDPTGCSIVREFGGHGVGRGFHEEPFVSYVTPKGSEMVLVPGMMFTIEPMVNEGSPDFFVDEDDDWTVYTIDDGLSAQIEYMVLVTEDGVEVLTR